MAMNSGASRTPPILERCEDISSEWIDLVLKASGIAAPSVSGVEVETIGAGNASDTRRVLIEYDGDPGDAPRSLVCKFHPDREEQRQGMKAGGTFDREIGSYRAISESHACRIPKPYLLATENGFFNLVTEDLSPSAIPGDQIAGCTVADAEAVLIQMAGLHGAFSHLQEDGAPDWVMHMSTMADFFGADILAGGSIASDRFGDQLTSEHYSTVRECAELADAWHRLPWARLTLTHGDLRADNVLFEKSRTGNEAVLIDWQLTGLRNPMYDVAYFLASSLSVEDRRKHEKRLLGLYLDAVGEHVPEYREEQALSDYRMSMVASLTINILSTAVLPRVRSVDELVLTLLNRGTAAVDDWDSLTAIRAATA